MRHIVNHVLVQCSSLVNDLFTYCLTISFLYIAWFEGDATH